jgi:hypothetical protein
LPKLNVSNPFEVIPRGFQEIDFSNDAAAPLIGIIARQASWAVSVNCILRGEENIEHKGLIFSYCPFADISEAFDILREVEATDPDSLAVALCLALIVITQNFFGKGRFYKWYQRIRSQLTDLLLQKDMSNVSPAERRCLAWVWMVAAESWRINSRLLPGGHNLMQSLIHQFEEARSWGELEKLLKSFLWYDSLGEKWKACWEESMIARAT